MRIISYNYAQSLIIIASLDDELIGVQRNRVKTKRYYLVELQKLRRKKQFYST